jgi:hypothetical protein
VEDGPEEAGVLLSADVVSPYFTVESYALSDGSVIDKDIINGPPQPPPGFEAERAASILPLPERDIISSFPSYNWVFGCSAVSAAMIAGYYDRTGYPNIYTGQTNDGKMPLSDTAWPQWKDCAGVTYVSNPLVASQKGLDGRTSRGTIDNYWVSFNSTAPDPYLTNGWLEHTWGTAISDYMKTSQSTWPYQSRDGSTWFWSYSSAAKYNCYTMETTKPSGETYTIAEVDGTYGRKRFYEARGYTILDCYNQKTENQVTGGFSLADFKAEIDAGHPVLLNLTGHSIVGYGYSGSTIFVRDSWDSDPEKTYTMTWGGSYSYAGMPLRSVSVVQLAPPASSPPPPPEEVTASDGTFFHKVSVSWEPASDAAYYQVYRNYENDFTSATKLTKCPVWNPFDDCTVPADEQFYYWVVACNALGCSAPSPHSLGWRYQGLTNYLPLFNR